MNYEISTTGMATGLRKRVAQILEVGSARDGLSRYIDIGLITLIFLNVIAITLESVPSLQARYETAFQRFEVFSVLVFTLEYLARVWSSVELDGVDGKRPLTARLKYMISPLVLIDLIAILPFYLAYFVALDLRFLRVLRLLRIFKLTRYSPAMVTMLEVLREEISVLLAATFILFVLMILASSGIYLLEHEVQPEAFGSIPASMWWAMISLTTVGYGDVTPVTTLGKVFGAMIALIGVGMVALPTAILASGFANAFRRRRVSYEQQLGFALDDGELSEDEVASLKQIQQDLGLSPEDAEHIYQLALKSFHRQHRHCPSCGGGSQEKESRQAGSGQS